MWTYKGQLERIIDGDTLDFWLTLTPQQNKTVGEHELFDFGFSFYGPSWFASSPVVHHERVRLWGINAPELRGEEREEGREAMQALALLVAEHPEGQFSLETIKDRGKYGRYVAKVDLDGIDLSQWMVDNGYAVWKEY